MATGAPRHDFARFGMEVYRASPRQADVIVIAGTINNKMAPVLKLLYEQMSEPKYVLAMGACAVSGGPFYLNSYMLSRVRIISYRWMFMSRAALRVLKPSCTACFSCSRKIKTETMKSRKKRNKSHDISK